MGGRRQVVERPAKRLDAATVAGTIGVHPVVVRIAVECFAPITLPWKSQFVSVKWGLVETCNDNDVLAFSLDPPVEGEDPVVIIDMKYVQPCCLQGGQPTPDAEQLPGETLEIAHVLVLFEPIPPDLIRTSRLVVPLFVFQKLLAHKQMRDTHRCCNQSHGNA